jgi:putative transposase
VRKVWRQLRREGISAARCAVARRMRRMGLQGVVRGKAIRTTVPDKAAPCPADKVNRRFRAPRPNQLWASGFTYAATWQGFVYGAFVIGVFARRIVGWRVSRKAQAGLAESIIGLFKTEAIRRLGPWKSLEAVEFATLEWVDWFNNRRLLEPIGTSHPPRPRRATMPAGRRSRWP